MMTPLNPLNVHYLIVHCSATRPGLDIGVEEITRWHVDERGFTDIGYHYVLRRSGAIENGRSLSLQGAHAYGYNSSSVGICLIGGVDYDDLPTQNFTESQYSSLRIVLKALRLIFPNAHICGHRDLKTKHPTLKTCPCFDVRNWLILSQFR